MADPSDTALQESARHRGYKLVKSRRRKPGLGDFGKFGLVDSAGKQVLGFGEDGLTATAEDIEAFLRGGTLNSWKQSAASTPALSPVQESALGRARVKAKTSASNARGTGSRARKSPSRTENVLTSKPGRSVRSEKPSIWLDTKREPVAKLPERKAEPVLNIRPAKPADAAALADLLSRLNGVVTESAAITQFLREQARSRSGAFVADLGQIVGLVSWAVIPVLHCGLVGRVTAIVVLERHRRKGIGRQLMTNVLEVLAKAGCANVEAISDIEIRNAHNFFRANGFEQTSYRFARQL